MKSIQEFKAALDYLQHLINQKDVTMSELELEQKVQYQRSQDHLKAMVRDNKVHIQNTLQNKNMKKITQRLLT